MKDDSCPDEVDEDATAESEKLRNSIIEEEKEIIESKETKSLHLR